MEFGGKLGPRQHSIGRSKARRTKYRASLTRGDCGEVASQMATWKSRDKQPKVAAWKPWPEVERKAENDSEQCLPSPIGRELEAIAAGPTCSSVVLNDQRGKDDPGVLI